jgi:hypothetical protein
MKIVSSLSLILLSGLVCVPASAQTAKPSVAADAPAKPLIATMTSEQFQKVIQAMGFECTRGKTDGKDDTFFTFRAEGYKVAAFFHDASYLEHSRT